MAEVKRIIQIIPADGWYVVYDGGGDLGEMWERLACWAVVEMGDGTTEVVGMDATGGGSRLVFCDEGADSARYEHESGRSTPPAAPNNR